MLLLPSQKIPKPTAYRQEGEPLHKSFQAAAHAAMFPVRVQGVGFIPTRLDTYEEL